MKSLEESIEITFENTCDFDSFMRSLRNPADWNWDEDEVDNDSGIDAELVYGKNSNKFTDFSIYSHEMQYHNIEEEVKGCFSDKGVPERERHVGKRIYISGAYYEEQEEAFFKAVIERANSHGHVLIRRCMFDYEECSFEGYYKDII